MAAFLGFSLALSACGSNDTDDDVAAVDPTPDTTPVETPDTASPTAGANGAEPEVDRVLEHARVLAVDIGPRVAGSSAEFETADYIAAEFEAYGYEVELQQFEFDGNRFPPGELELGEATLQGLSLVGSADGEATGTLVSGGAATAEELDAAEVDGAIVVAERGETPFGEMYEGVAERGGVGLVVVNNEEVPLANATLGTSASIPVISVGEGDREALMMAIDGGLTATVVASGQTSTSVNVFAQAPGTDRCLVLSGGHHDTVPASPGANDNASGVAHVLEIARAMAEDGAPPGLCFATFGAEESGLHGSRAMASEMAESGALPEYMLNFDVTGLGSPVQAIGSESLVQRSIELGRELGASITRSVLPPNLGSDHMSFEQVGVSVLFFTTGMYDEYHSPDDTFDILSEETVRAVLVNGYALVMDLYAELAPDE